MTITNRISKYVGDKNKKGEDIRSNIENKELYTIPRPTAPVTNPTTTRIDFDTMLIKMEVDEYVNCKFMIK